MALGKTSNRQEQEWYFQRYSVHLPASGEFVLFNRSWYNRAGVEKVMRFCTKKEYNSFFKEVALFEDMLVDAGFTILKYFLDISKSEQRSRLMDRRKDPLKQWKISPVNANNKDKSHIAILTHLLNQMDYPNKNEELLSHDYGLVASCNGNLYKRKTILNY